MKRVYCGSRDLPKGSKYGTVKECHEMGEIRRYGIIKVVKVSKKNEDKIINKLFNLKSKHEKLKEEYVNIEIDIKKENKKKKPNENTINKYESMLQKTSLKIKKIEDEFDKIKNSAL